MTMFLLVLTAIGFTLTQGLLYYYLWRRLAVSTQLGSPWRSRVAWILASLGIFSFAVLMSARYLSPSIGRSAGWPAFLWLACFFQLAALFGLVDLGTLVVKLGRRLTRKSTGDGPADPQRRAFVNRALGGGVAIGAVGLTGSGTVNAMKTPGVVDIEISLARIGSSIDGFRIVQITDLHVGNTIGRSFVQDVVDRANAAAPDLIAITGDLVDGSVEDLAEEIAPLADLRAPHGVYFVTGNHEYYAGANEWIEHIGSMGIRVLRNERVSIGDTDGFDLVGVDDHNAGRWPGHGPDMGKAVAGRDEDRELIVLAHQPRQIHESVKFGAGLQLSGHTHGGQIWPWHYMAMAQQGGLLAGLSRHDKTQLYISRGTGYWGPPVRVFAPSEIARITLRSSR